MSLAKELKMWKDMQMALNEIPREHRSANHFHYLKEINGRVAEVQELMKYAKKRANV